MDWVAITCGSAVFYAAGRWLHGRLQARKSSAGLCKGDRLVINIPAWEQQGVSEHACRLARADSWFRDGVLLMYCRRGIPLKAVVANCEAKWFLQELQVGTLCLSVPTSSCISEQGPANPTL